METLEKLIPGNFYHIYNHGVGNRNLFQKTENYEHFLQKYDKYIPPIADTYAWVLMPNHFHMLVKVKELAVFIPDSDRVSNPLRDIKRNRKIEDIPSLQFSKLFNSYAQAFNKYFETHGALFERPFKRKLVDSIDYLRELVVYIHNNPVPMEQLPHLYIRQNN
jgi:putative transposase